MKINVLAGHGGSIDGAGFVRDNFVKYAISMGHDVMVYHNMNLYDTIGVDKTRKFEPYEVMFKYGDKTRLRPADLLVIYSVETPLRYDPENEHQREMQKWETELVRQQKADGTRTMFVELCHNRTFSGKPFAHYHLPLFKEIESFVTFGPGDRIMRAFELADKDFYDKWLKPRVVFIQHNTLYNPVKNWLPFEDKKLAQFYWQGRWASWKGYKEWIDLKERCRDAGFDMNLTFNGLTATISVITDLTVTLKPKVFLPYIDYHRKSPGRIVFQDEIAPKTMIYPKYRHDDGFDAMQRAGFGMYTTKLKRNMNFFPEYATLDVVQAGAILCMPSWYWSKDRGFLTGRPADYGCVGLPDTNEELPEFIDEAKSLQSSKKLYDAYRELAWARFIDNADFPGIVQKVIDAGMNPINDDSSYNDLQASLF